MEMIWVIGWGITVGISIVGILDIEKNSFIKATIYILINAVLSIVIWPIILGMAIGNQFSRGL